MSPVPCEEVSLDAKLGFLRDCRNYPAPCHRIEVKETHMSWVFLTETHAYKLKKPVRQSAIDFGSVAARRYYCEEELRLNRRLAPDVYLGVVPLCLDWQGRLHLDRWGRPVEWLVWMTRLPAAGMLDRALIDMQVGSTDMVRIAKRLATFYRHASPAGLSNAAYAASLERQIDENFKALCAPAYELCEVPVQALCEQQRSTLHQLQPVLAARVADGRIVEGHGDLRPEHICLRPKLAMIDCLEFSRELRLVDPIDELAFLCLEIERLYADGHATTLMRAYKDAAHDDPPEVLIAWYKSLRAGVRARLAIQHLDEARYRAEDSWRLRANSYLRLARAYLDLVQSVSASLSATSDSAP